jgi:hypothetical protein
MLVDGESGFSAASGLTTVDVSQGPVRLNVELAKIQERCVLVDLHCCTRVVPTLPSQCRLLAV